MRRIEVDDRRAVGAVDAVLRPIGRVGLEPVRARSGDDVADQRLDVEQRHVRRQRRVEVGDKVADDGAELPARGVVARRGVGLILDVRFV